MDSNKHTHTLSHLSANVKTAEWMTGMYSRSKDAYITKPGACTWAHAHRHTRAHTQSPLPGHFALERAEKLMRVQSFITLETERERGEK